MLINITNNYDVIQWNQNIKMLKIFWVAKIVNEFCKKVEKVVKSSDKIMQKIVTKKCKKCTLNLEYNPDLFYSREKYFIY